MTAGEGNIKFYDRWLPALGPGRYVARVTPELRAGSADKQDDELDPLDAAHQPERWFRVDAPRFALAGDESYSCFPAPGAKGNFDGVLPHIVFDRRTLPWERAIKKDQRPGEDTSRWPWLGLILLGDGDGPDLPEPAIGTLGNIVEAPGDLIGPDLALAPHETTSDPCRMLDLPVNLFCKVMPWARDLEYLAHVREVSTNGKETWSLLKDGTFSVIVGNRMPETLEPGTSGKDWGIRNTVHLVSLEGWAAFFDSCPSADAPHPWARAHAGRTCRVVVLATWRFYCQGHGSFAGLMTRLDDCGPLTFPGPTSALGKPAVAALQQGFTPIEHRFRTGETGLSWYRGPLSPVQRTLPESYPHLASADAALVLDPVTGMFNASYAAAWELGRLLALQDQAFCQALVAYRAAFGAWLRQTNTRAIEKEMPAEDHKRLLAMWPNSMAVDMPARFEAILEDGNYVRIAGPRPAEETPLPDVPVTLKTWLGEALLLYGVPFKYLVPHEMMLRRNSIRFFHLDPDWIEALLQGACSVGRDSRADALVDEVLRERFFKISCRSAEALRADAKEKAEDRRQRRETETRKQIALNWPLSGFLLRSDAVGEWVGLESAARDAEGQVLDILRKDRLAPDLLLCIVNGRIADLEIRQPPEAIHFGVNRTGMTKEESQTRGAPVFETVQRDAWKSVPVPLRGDSRVIRIGELANGLAGVNGQSGEFAVRMIGSPARVTFTLSSEGGTQ